MQEESKYFEHDTCELRRYSSVGYRKPLSLHPVDTPIQESLPPDTATSERGEY